MELNAELKEDSKEVQEKEVDIESEGRLEAKLDKSNKNNIDARIGLVTKKFKLAEAEANKNKEDADVARKLAEEAKSDNMKLAGMIEKLMGEVASVKEAKPAESVKPKDDPAAKAVNDMLDSLNGQFQDAVKAEDFGKALVLGNQITNLRLSNLNKPSINPDEIVEKVAKKVKEALPAAEPKSNPILDKWISDNDWFGTNEDATMFAEQLGVKLAKSGKYKPSDPADYKKLLVEVKERTEAVDAFKIKPTKKGGNSGMDFNNVEQGDYGDRLPNVNGDKKYLTQDEIEFCARYGLNTPAKLAAYAKTIGKEYKN